MTFCEKPRAMKDIGKEIGEKMPHSTSVSLDRTKKSLGVYSYFGVRPCPKYCVCVCVCVNVRGYGRRTEIHQH